MTTSTPIGEAGLRLRPWVALALAPVAWYVYELGLAAALRASCTTVGSWLGVAWGVGSLMACAVAMRIAWPLAVARVELAHPRHWVARIAALTAGIFALAIAFQTLATLIVPPCVH